MSKTALKKELAGYTKEQLIEVVLDLYASRTEVKEYFKFFLNPDSKALFEKFQKAAAKELSRVRRRTSKARISVVKKLVKEFRSFQPAMEYTYKLYDAILISALYNEYYYYFTETLFKGICTMVDYYLELADSNNELDSALDAIHRIIKSDSIGSRHFKQRIADVCQAYVNRKRI
ncbi:MAG: hypothetical protein HDS54_03330 [Barnesiella sp.]|nr:hypothetical protein [Barnesiella sp.]